MKSDPKKLEDEAAQLYQRVITDFATVKVDMGRGKFPQTPLARIAKFLLAPCSVCRSARSRQR